MIARLAQTLLLAGLFACSTPAAAAATYLATSAAELQPLTDGLVAGDTLLVAAGTYDLRTWRIRDIDGTPEAWIHIRPEGGPVAIRGNDNQNVINMDNVSYVHFEGFEVTYVGSLSGIDGLKLNSGTTSHHVVIKGCHFHDITGVGVNSKATELSHLDVADCHIERTGDTGEGMYLGCHDGSCLVRDSVVRRNHVHDTRGSQGDGIEIKRGSYRNIIEDNVVYNTNGYPGITLYRTDRGDPADNNIVRRNAVWQAGEGIFSGAETTIVNNIVFDCDYGINLRNYSGWGVSDLHVLNNTVYACSTTAVRLDDWNVATGSMVFVNNAAVQLTAGETAIAAPDGIGPALVESNVHWGTSAVTGSTLGGSPPGEFLSVMPLPGAIDLYPGIHSHLIDVGSFHPLVPADDFNRKPRPVDSAPEIGAYEWSYRANLGWRVDTEFKSVPDDVGPFPVPQHPDVGGAALKLAKRPGGSVAASWDVSSPCRSQNFQLFYGPLGSMGSYALSGSVCYLGIFGGITVDLPAEDLYIQLAGTNGYDVVGSLGRGSDGAEHPAPPPGHCAISSQALNTCP